MKSDTQLISENSKSFDYLKPLTTEESLRLKKMLLIMIRDIKKLCDDYKISFMLGGGSCLGAVRHNGFIPWDDDLDIMMLRNDYTKLINLLEEGKLGDSYEYDYPHKNNDSKNLFLKIYRKGTLDNELFNENAPFPKGIFVDVFPIDYVDKGTIKRKLHGILSNALRVIASSVFFTQYPSKKYKQVVSQNKKTKKIFYYRSIIGHICGIIPHKKWVYWFDKYNSSVAESEYVTIPAGRNLYLGEVQKTSTFLSVIHTDFEGIKLPIPKDYHAYLTSLYNNYMELPSEEKRERHLIFQFKCDMQSE